MEEAVQAYCARLARTPVEKDPVLRDMEARAREPRFPIVGAEVGAILEILARARGARRVFEVGSGFGYSAWFFARAVGPAGEVHLTDFKKENLDAARDYLKRSGYETKFQFHAGDAMEALVREIGKAPFDVYFIDADKHRYPDYWKVIRPKLRPGDLVLADNLLWGGAVADPKVTDADTEGLRRFASECAGDPQIRFTLLPVRDGVGIAQRL
ncbi:MAG TPA: O-methyltransferase [Planctomycetota bacterium]|nr:O-methyltransferase [Planctomycetota bacterium]